MLNDIQRAFLAEQTVQKKVYTFAVGSSANSTTLEFVMSRRNDDYVVYKLKNLTSFGV